MTDQANQLRGLVQHRGEPAGPASSGSAARAIAVASGKGGVGKSSLALNLAIELSRLHTRVGLLDASLSLGTIDLLCGLNGYWNLGHVISGARRLDDIVLPGPAGVRIVPGVGELDESNNRPPSARKDLQDQLSGLEAECDFLVVDTSGGLQRFVRQLLAAADCVLVVTTPEPTAIANAYATIKTLGNNASPRVELVVNRVDGARQARAILDRLRRTTNVFLEGDIEAAGWIPEDPHVAAAVADRLPLALDAPDSPAARAIQQIARRLFYQHQSHSDRGTFFERFWHCRLPQAA